MMFGPMGGPHGPQERQKEPLPKHLNEIFPYIKKVWGGFFKRLFYIYKLVWEARPWILFFMLAAAVFEGVMPVISAYIGKLLLNAISEGINSSLAMGFTAITTMLIIQFAYNFVYSLVSRLSSMVNRIAGEIVTNHIKLKIMNKAKEIDLRSFDIPEFYEKLENANREASNRPLQILSSTLSIVSTAISMISFIVILWSVAWFAPFSVALFAIPSAIINYIYRKKNVMYMRWRSKDRRKMQYYSDLLTNKDTVKEIRLLGLSDKFIDDYQNVFSRYFKGMKKLIYQENLWTMAVTLLSVVINCLLYLYIAYAVASGTNGLSIGDYSLYTGALNSISTGISNLFTITATIYEGTLFIDNMILFMAEKKTIVPSLAEPAHVQHHVPHEIRFENVSFRYPGMDRDVLHDINLTIHSGESIVLVGLNGAGKTTLIKLLTRLYDPTSGKIILDGRDIKEYNVEELYSLFGIIFQDFGKYAVTVRENIGFGNIAKEATDEAVSCAARQSNAEDFIKRFDLGYDTPLMRIFETDGKELSIGQWQKLAVARAFYSNADILILDEPTASLDALAEQEIFNQFEELRKGKLTVFVSHRLSSAVRASQIVVLSQGTIQEKGTHKELMALHGIYHHLFSTQAEHYINSTDLEQHGEHPFQPDEKHPPDNVPPGPHKPPMPSK